MFPTSLDDFKLQQRELHQRAARYQLVRSLTKSANWTDKIITSIGQTLIVIGQQLLSRTQAAH